MEELPLIRSVDSDGSVGLGRIFSEVLNVAEDVAFAVLRGKVAEMGAEAEICYGTFEVGPRVDGDVFEQDKAAPVDQLEPEPGKVWAKSKEGEPVLVSGLSRALAHTFEIPVNGSALSM